MGHAVRRDVRRRVPDQREEAEVSKPINWAPLNDKIFEMFYEGGNVNFIDLCAGIGGFRLGFEQAGFECIGFAERDKFARKSYEAMYDTEDEWTARDIADLRSGDIPQSDVWTFGFPCQDISIAGKRAGLSGERSGIFYKILELVKGKDPEDKPTFLVAENVKNLLSIDAGRGFKEVLAEMDEAGYDAEWKVFNSKDYGTPQNRERVYLVGHLRDRGRREVFHSEYDQGNDVQIKAVAKLDVKNLEMHKNVYDTSGVAPCVTSNFEKGSATKIIVSGELDIKSLEMLKRVYSPEGISPALNTCQGGSRQPKINTDDYLIRKLTPRECFRLQGFPDELFDKAQAVNSESQLYKQAGNAVTVNVARHVAECIMRSEINHL